MNLVKKILLVHPDSGLRRRCIMLLAASGFDVRSFGTANEACEAAQGEWFDLAVLEHNLPDAPEFDLADRLRKIQPTLSVMLLVEELEFPLVVKSIRQGVADVIPPSEDLAPVVARVCAFFEVVPSMTDDINSSELAAAERVLECAGGFNKNNGNSSHASHQHSGDLVQAAHEKALLERHLERVSHERNALETQLKTLLVQIHDSSRLSTDAADLRSQRELIAAAQAAIDGKARQLAEQRAELVRERGALAEERRRIEQCSPAHSVEVTQIVQERTQLAEWRRQLNEQAELLRSEGTRLHQDRAQLTHERRSWHKDLDTLRDQEENLRRYEARLRELQSSLEADRVGMLGHNSQPAPSITASDFAGLDAATLKESWTKFKRTTELFEIEKTHLREDRLALRDWEKALKLREATLIAREGKLADMDKRLRTQINSAPSAPRAVEPSETTQYSAVDRMLSLTRSPFEAAKHVLRGRK